MTVKVYYDRDNETFLSEKELADFKKQMAEEKKEAGWHDDDIVDILIDVMDGEELWNLLSEEGKKKIAEQATERYFTSDTIVEGEIEI